MKKLNHVKVDFFQDVRRKWRWRFVTVWDAKNKNGEPIVIENIEYVQTAGVATKEDCKGHWNRWPKQAWEEDTLVVEEVHPYERKRSWWRRFFGCMVALAIVGCGYKEIRGTYEDGEFKPQDSGNYESTVRRVAGITVTDSLNRVESAREKSKAEASSKLVWIGAACWVLAIAAVVAGVVMQGWKLAASVAFWKGDATEDTFEWRFMPLVYPVAAP